MGELLVLRHGETQWSRSGRHTGLTDIPLTARGEEQARSAARLLHGRRIGLALVSPLRRAVRTAELAGLGGFQLDPDLHEWDYGLYEGVTTAQIEKTRPGWNLWTDGVPDRGPGDPGEDAEKVGRRVDRVLRKVRSAMTDQDAGEDVIVVAHSHVLRVLVARSLGLAPGGGALFQLGTAAMGTIGTEHGRAVVTGWNIISVDG
ncbi:histidine phosphatase family protein [Kitasatospora sp. MBT63]|uniref:histidine phosphatase family protein n=1 Tax=Kitasatospora sp. MBT63 TaxID=1444768 RepID=UPI00053A8789|nr:histidine phosphatase family protein [Kitasatospora sp. MBT63]